MPKIICSPSYELGLVKEKNDDLIRRNRELEEEILLLKTYILKHSIPLPKTKPTRPETPRLTGEKGYLKATTASTSRAIRKSTSDVTSQRVESTIRVGNEQGHFKGGRFVSLLSGERHFQFSTTSSREKRSPFKPYRRYQAYSLGPERWPSSDESDTTFVNDTDDEDLDQSKDIQETLSEKTGLHKYFPSHLSSVPVSSQMKFDYLKRGLRLAQEIFFHGARKYLPRVPRLQGPHEVQLGRTELEHLVLFAFSSKEVVIGGRHIHRQDLESILGDLTLMRNKVCHFGNASSRFLSLASCEYYMQAVQSLAILFEDEKRAFKVRKLRDRMVARVEKIPKQYEQMLLLTELPFARPWGAHVEEVFEHFLRNGVDEDEYIKGVPSLMLRAAHDWDRRRPKPSNGEWLPPSMRDQL
ncbi:hypothetical protein GGS26DRAFT_602850 [Hypomontagnella submonticulosa]|nr:hypothetical protein GGS26DRAFT_602850 [Hypomontagnella submonticulosa]